MKHPTRTWGNAEADHVRRYEMIDVVGESLDSHLPGVASLLESSGANGDVGGIRGACYWVW
jgi:hypothetical protein